MILAAAEIYRSLYTSGVMLTTVLSSNRTLQQGNWVYVIAGVIEMVAILASLYWLMRYMVTELFPLVYLQAGQPRESEGATMLYCAFGALVLAFAAQVGAVLAVVIMHLAR